MNVDLTKKKVEVSNNFVSRRILLVILMILLTEALLFTPLSATYALSFGFLGFCFCRLFLSVLLALYISRRLNLPLTAVVIGAVFPFAQSTLISSNWLKQWMFACRVPGEMYMGVAAILALADLLLFVRYLVVRTAFRLRNRRVADIAADDDDNEMLHLTADDDRATVVVTKSSQRRSSRCVGIIVVLGCVCGLTELFWTIGVQYSSPDPSNFTSCGTVPSAQALLDEVIRHGLLHNVTLSPYTICAVAWDADGAYFARTLPDIAALLFLPAPLRTCELCCLGLV
jgi:hypothetical protein